MIKQGDQYALGIRLTAEGEALDISAIADVEICLGTLVKHWRAEGASEVQHDAEASVFYFPLSQAETFAFKKLGRKVPLDIRVKYTTGDVVGIRPQKIDVIESISKEVI
ncbi:MAG: hypothetical protein Q4C56_04160 [Peptococcaceae bacterium]|nr:hypothetical protein [Peptococcaceae bacterium]